MASRCIPCLLVLCLLLLWAAPAGSAPGGMTPPYPVAVAAAPPAGETQQTSQCHPFLHASETATMAFGQGAEREPAQLPLALEPFPWNAADGTCRAAAIPASASHRGPPIYALTARLRL